MKAQNEIYKMADDDNNSAEQLFNYYIKVITEYVNNAYNKIKCLSDDELINHFLEEYSKCIQLIYWMQRIGALSNLFNVMWIFAIVVVGFLLILAPMAIDYIKENNITA
jgi:hypothetical protein